MFALFNTSIFWCLMADTFRSEQAKRLFGFIGVGGTLGSIAGSAATAALATTIGTMNLLLVSAVVAGDRGRSCRDALSASARRAVRERARPSRDQDRESIGGSVWAGFTHVAASPYLLGICAFMILFTIGSTFLYFAQSRPRGREYADEAARTAVLAQFELAAQIAHGRHADFLYRPDHSMGRACGRRWRCSRSSACSDSGRWRRYRYSRRSPCSRCFGAAANFAITNPAMEVLFTVVRREDKYKAKNVIETFVYRGGDQLGAWAYTGLSALGLGLVGISYVAVPLSMVWLGLGLWLGKRQAQMAAGEHPVVKEMSTAVPVTT